MKRTRLKYHWDYIIVSTLLGLLLATLVIGGIQIYSERHMPADSTTVVTE